MAVLEVFLAITLIYVVMSQIQISLPAKYSDTTNMDRLHRYAHDIAFSLCDSLKAKRAILNDTFTFDLHDTLPRDIAYRIYFYKNSSNNHLLDSNVTVLDGGRVELFYDEFYNLDAWTGNISNPVPTATNASWNITPYGYNTTAENNTNAYRKNYSEHYLVHQQSTKGYTDINVTFWHKINSGIDSYRFDWYNGTGWTTGPVMAQTDWTLYNFWYGTDPAAASDNPNFAIRFRCYESTILTSDACWLDTLRITGIPKDVSKATSSCIIAGGPVKSNYSVSVCNYQGSDCLSQIAAWDSNFFALMGNENFTVSFNPTQNGSIVEFSFVAFNNQTNQTTLFYDSAGNQIASYNITATYSMFSLDLTDFFPDPNGSYNLTIKPTVNATFDWINLNVSKNVYSPRRVVVQTWNAGD